jgi:hypothetical protein
MTAVRYRRGYRQQMRRAFPPAFVPTLPAATREVEAEALTIPQLFDYLASPVASAVRVRP